MARPKPEVFDITKRKFHNVLQGVAPPYVRLNDHDKQTFIDWSNENIERFWLGPKGPIASSNVIVIDDPQRKLHYPYSLYFFFFSFLRDSLFKPSSSGGHYSTYQEA